MFFGDLCDTFYVFFARIIQTLSKNTVRDVLDRVWNDSGDESPEKSDKDYNNECNTYTVRLLTDSFY